MTGNGEYEGSPIGYHWHKSKPLLLKQPHSTKQNIDTCIDNECPKK